MFLFFVFIFHQQKTKTIFLYKKIGVYSYERKKFQLFLLDILINILNKIVKATN